MSNPLVSIIIPTYNRAHLIAETLDSILAQTYTNWECIIVDDGSTDSSVQVVENHLNKDKRFMFFKRPTHLKKGGNSCRNYGFQKSKGVFINWFDSDDLMLSRFIEYKVNTLVTENVDFVFSETINFNTSGDTSPIFEADNSTVLISAYNFIKQQLAFCTLDFMARKSSIGALKFNIDLTSGQEYNFFARYLCVNTNGKHITKVLSRRRVHPESIQSDVSKMVATNLNEYHKSTVENKFILLEDINTIGDYKSKLYLVSSIISFSYRLAEKKQDIPFFSEILRQIIKVKGINSALYYYVSIKGARYVGKGYRLYKKALS